jgi:UDP-2,3-diacylglucosamine hydrolase
VATVFISDLHLDDSRPHITTLFEHYLASDEVRKAHALYILGDLVEAWLGDDDDAELSARMAGAIHAVADAGVAVYFMHGNRDFLIGHTYAERAGMQLIEDDATVHRIEGTPTLLMHGDTLCTDDVEYQAVRARVRQPAWKAQVLATPLAERRALAMRSRAQSRSHTGSADDTIMDVNQGAVEQTMRDAGVTRLIHGHTHRPAIHEFTLDGEPVQRIVLGDWYQQGSVLVVAPSRIDLRTIPTS